MACVYGSRLLLLKTINKNSQGQKGVFLMTFSFIEIERRAVEPPPPRVQCSFFFFFFFPSLNINIHMFVSFFKDRKASRHFTFVVFSMLEECC